MADEITDEEIADEEIIDLGDSGARMPGATMPAGQNGRDSNVGTADGITRCKAGIATEATNTAVQAESSNFE
jgi:hypothetical protein